MSTTHPSRLATRLAAIVACVALASTAHAQRRVELAPNAPADRPVDARTLCQRNAMYRSIAPLVEQARASYPAARQRFLSGLPRGETFFVTAVLKDSLDRQERIFVAVDTIGGGRIAGRIASQINLVRGYRYGQPYALSEKDLQDWLISKVDGTEEGNIVGKFLDTYRPPTTCADSSRAH